MKIPLVRHGQTNLNNPRKMKCISYLELMKKLNEFYIYANKGLYIDNVIEKDKYVIVYSNSVNDSDSNFIANLDVISKEEFNSINKEIEKEMNKYNEEVYYMISPLNSNIYNNRKEILEENSFKQENNEVWQIFEDFDKLEEIETGCKCNIKLEKTNDMEKFAIISDECFSTGDIEDPYGSLNKGYISIYNNYTEKEKFKYKRDFFFIKLNDNIIGVTVSVYGDGICGIYGLAINKKYRGHGIGKEGLRKQLEICKEKDIEIAFLQTEDGFYPADTYRKFGFKDICNVYYYVKKN